MVRASIIIVTHNSVANIEKCLRSIYEQHHDESFEVLVVDNCSQDATTALVEALRLPRFKLIKSSANNGFGAANNLAVSHAAGEFIYLINPDSYFVEPVLPAYLSFMTAHPDAAACTGVLFEDDEKTISTTIGSFPGRHSVIEDLGFHLLRRRLNQRRLQAARAPFAVDFISGASIFMRRDLFTSVGGFDQRFFLYYEETDLFLRIAKERKMQPWVLPDVKLVHIGGFSTGKKGFNAELHKVYQQSRFDFLKKHYSAGVAHAITRTDEIRRWIKSLKTPTA